MTLASAAFAFVSFFLLTSIECDIVTLSVSDNRNYLSSTLWHKMSPTAEIICLRHCDIKCLRQQKLFVFDIVTKSVSDNRNYVSSTLWHKMSPTTEIIRLRHCDIKCLRQQKLFVFDIVTKSVSYNRNYVSLTLWHCLSVTLAAVSDVQPFPEWRRSSNNCDVLYNIFETSTYL